MRWKVKTEKNWHSHFAFWPVKVEGEWVWLERVLRKGWKRSPSHRPTNGGWTWDYVNSEFDLIKRADSERAMQESNVGQMAMGSNAARQKGTTGGLGLTMPDISDPAENIINQLRARQNRNNQS